MILLFIFIAIALLIGVASWLCSYQKDMEVGIGGLITASLILGAIYLIVIFVSYDNYIGLRQFKDAGYVQQVKSIEMYKKMALDEIKKEGPTIGTDMKFQGYQQEVSKMIIELRTAVNKYNDSIISKRKLGTNLFFNWCIVMPDADMQIITIGQ